MRINHNVPAMVTQARPEFAELVASISRDFFKVLRMPRSEQTPIHADGSGHGLIAGGVPDAV